MKKLSLRTWLGLGATILLLASVAYLLERSKSSAAHPSTAATSVETAKASGRTDNNHLSSGSTAETATKHSADRGTPVAQARMPIGVFLAAAAVASFLLAGLIASSQSPPLARVQMLLIGSVIAVIALALVFASSQLSEDRPSELQFLVAAVLLVICVIVLILCYVPPLIPKLRGVTSVFVQITALLCIAGGAGGIASHLVSNDGDLIMPGVSTFTKELPLQSTASGVSATSDAAERAAADEDTAVGSSPRRTVPSGSTRKVKRFAFHIGFLGDLLLGIITANALHLALASLVTYDKQEDEKRKQYFTLLALGILSGFAGAKALTSWSNQLTPSAARNIFREEVKPAVTAKENSEAIILPQAIETSKAVTDCLARFEWPNEAELTLMRTFASVVKDTKKPLEKFSVDELVAAAGSELFANAAGAASETTKKYVALVIDQPNVPRAQGWTARVLRGLSLVFEGARTGTGWYAEASSDLSQLWMDAATSDQRSSSALFANFAAFAAMMSRDPEQPDRQMIKRRFDWGGAGPSRGRNRRATTLAREVATFLLGEPLKGSLSTPTGATDSAAPSRRTAEPQPPEQQKPVDAAAEKPVPKQLAVATETRPGTQASPDERIALLRLVTTMKAVPKEVLERLAGTSESHKALYSPFIEAAPSFPAPVPISSPSPSPSTNRSTTPIATPPATATSTPDDHLE